MPVKILLLHEFYRSANPSGEDAMYRSERRLLEAAGHDVDAVEVHNDDIGPGPVARVAAGLEALWSARTYMALRRRIRRNRPDVLHCHNTFPLISPSAYRAAQHAGVAVVQTLHNYRLICPSGMLLRNGRPCEDCVGRAPLPAIRHRCYRGSAVASAATAAMLVLNRALGSFRRDVDRYIVLTEFARRLLVRGGLPGERLIVRPNGLASDPGEGRGDGGFALFAGRLSAEKGVATLIDAWRRSPPLPLLVAGDGPLRADLEQRVRVSGAPVRFLGRLPHGEVLELMREAAVVVMPSECYEGLPVGFIEALACGAPIAASNIGALGALMSHGVNGVHFRAGDAADLAARVAELLVSPVELRAIRARNRALFESHYSPAEARRSLEAVYRDAIEAQRARRVRYPVERIQRSRSTRETNTGPETR